MCIDEVMKVIENMNSEDKSKILELIKEKYDLMNLPRDTSFIVGSTYEFWLNEEDSIYDDYIDN